MILHVLKTVNDYLPVAWRAGSRKGYAFDILFSLFSTLQTTIRQQFLQISLLTSESQGNFSLLSFQLIILRALRLTNDSLNLRNVAIIDGTEIRVVLLGFTATQTEINNVQEVIDRYRGIGTRVVIEQI